MMKIVDSDLFFYIGLGMEGFVDKVEKIFVNEYVFFVFIVEKLDLLKDLDVVEEYDYESEEEYEYGDINLYVWLNFVYME